MGTAVTINGTAYTVPAEGDTGYAESFHALLVALTRRVSQVVHFGAASGATAGVPLYLAPWLVSSWTASANEVKWRAPVAGKLRKLHVITTAPGGLPACTITVRKNGSDTALTCQIPNGPTAASDLTNTVTIAAGDDVSVSVFSSGTGFDNLCASMEFAPS